MEFLEFSLSALLVRRKPENHTYAMAYTYNIISISLPFKVLVNNDKEMRLLILHKMIFLVTKYGIIIK